MLRRNLQFILKTIPRFHRERLILQAKICQPQLFINNSCSTQSHIVQMRGLDAEAKEEDVIDFFKSLNIKPINIHIRCDSAGRVTGATEVEFATHAEAVVAMRKRTAFIGNRFIRLTLKTSETSANQEMSSVTENVQQKRHTLSKNGIVVDGNIERTEHHTGFFVRMKNVPIRMTEQAIFQFFWPVNVTPVSVKPVFDENGFKTGELDVEFLTHDDAVRAMSKNNAYLGKKFVELTLNSTPRPGEQGAIDKDETNTIMQKSDSDANSELRSL